ncbi:MAG: proteasome assembly chaperone family protein [Methanolobus sp.]|nr:proteasome assembly chaperone family protein [Methanolobus sp.]
MQEIEVIRIKENVHLNNPVLIVGLPGVGHVGKLVAEHLVEELNAEKILEIYSQHFPPQVLVDENSETHLVNNEMYVCKTEKHDIIALIGDHQSSTTEGHYKLCTLYLDIAREFGVQRIYTLGGFPTGQLTYSEEVLGAVNNLEMIEELKEYGVNFKENEPGGGIVGASGLLLGMSKLEKIDAACLMGLTSGYLVDPKSAQSLLKVICKIFELDINVGPLEERAKEMEKIVARLREVEQQQKGIPEMSTVNDDDLGYIG